MSHRDGGTPEGNPVPLLDVFEVQDRDAWKGEVERLLKGAPFAKKMFTDTLEGITVQALYSRYDGPGHPWQETLPGQAPFVRGPGDLNGGWLVAQELPLPTASEFNAAVREDLQRGQTAVNLVLDRAGMSGSDRTDAVTVEGTSIKDLADLRTALEGVDLSSVPVFVQAGAAHRRVAEDLKTLVEESGAEFRGSLGCDPMAGLAREGSLPAGTEKAYDDLASVTRWALDSAPGVRTLPIHEGTWHDGGADGALGLGLMLASAVHSLREMESRGLPLEDLHDRIQFHLCVGSDFFLEIARIRALRILVSRIQTACGQVPRAPMILARTSRRSRTLLDPHVNLLRSTTQAMSAVFGGVDALHVAPFDECLGAPGEFSRRIARNVQLILKHECHLDVVTDPSGGSWYVEHLTGQVAEAAWKHFQAIEEQGGMEAALKSGWVQEQVKAAATLRAGRLASRRDILVGTNQYPDPNPLEAVVEPPAVPSVSGTAEPIAPGRDSEPFEELRRQVEAIALERPASARVFCACLGDFARYMPRLEFTRRFFRVGGFEVTGDRFFESGRAAAEAALADGAGTVVLVGLDATYPDMGPEFVEVLAGAKQPPVVMAAGRPEAWEAAEGVDTFIHARSNILSVLSDLADRAGGAS